MGTNYYLTHNYCLLCKRYDKIHLGKFNVGWKFLLNYNDGKYYKNWREMKQFLRQSKGIVVDEYGNEIDVEEFINTVESSQHLKSRTKDIEELHCMVDEDGFEFYDGEFC